jgi:hypothetical protein
MRQKMSNALCTFLYPGRMAGIGEPPDNAPNIAIPDHGKWVSIYGGGDDHANPCTVVYDPQVLRDMAHVLEEAADLFEQNQIKAKRG